MTSCAQPPLPGRERLLEILRQLFAERRGIAADTIGASQSFDELGIDSVDAVLLSGELSEHLHVELAPDFLLQYFTLEEVVDGLLQLDGAVESGSRGSKKTTIYFFQGGPARQKDAPRLASYCEPFLVMETLSLGDWWQWIEAGCQLVPLVQSSCDTIEEQCPHGEIRLAGHSLGGHFALAVALELKRRGRSAVGVYLLDSSAEPPEEGEIKKNGFLKRSVRAIGQKGVQRARRLARLPALEAVPGTDPNSENGILRAGVEALENPFARSLLLRGANRRPPKLANRQSIRIDNAIRAKLFDLMCRQWLASLSPNAAGNIPVTLFRAQSPGAPDLGWSKFCANLLIVQTEGNHLEMMQEPHVHNLATRLSAAVAEESTVHSRF